MQDARLGQLHPAGFPGVMVVVAGEMQRAVYDQMGQMMGGPAGSGGGFAADLSSARMISPGRPGAGGG